MRRTSIIASVTASSMLVAGLAFAMTSDETPDDGSTGVEAETATTDDDSADDGTTDDGPSDDNPSSSDDDSTDDSSSSSSDDDGPDDSSSSSSDDDGPDDDQPLAATIVATHQAVEVGSITVEATGLTVRLLYSDATEGWLTRVERSEGFEVEVSFLSGEDRVDVKAEVDDGQLRFRVRDRRTEERTETLVSDDGTTTTMNRDDDLDEDGDEPDDNDDSDDDADDSDDSADDGDDSDDSADDGDDSDDSDDSDD